MSLTEKSQFLTEAVLRTHAGWTMSSKMPQVYIHYLGNESVNSLLEIKGIISKDNKESNLLKSIYCPNCNEPNKPDSRFCLKCKMILSYTAYENTIEERQRKEKELYEFKQKHEIDIKKLEERLEKRFQQIISIIDVSKLK